MPLLGKCVCVYAELRLSGSTCAHACGRGHSLEVQSFTARTFLENEESFEKFWKVMMLKNNKDMLISEDIFWNVRTCLCRRTLGDGQLSNLL